MAGSRTFEQLVEQHVRRWEIERSAAVPQPRHPCVALSRLPGAGGSELGQRVAESLDYEFFGIEIVDQIAREQRVQRRLVADLDERVRSRIDRFVIDAFRSRTFKESDYLSCVVRTIAILGERGRAVILGRGAPFILGAEKALRVLIVAPDAMRIERMTKLHDLSAAEGAARIAREDAQRLEFLHQFGVNPDVPAHYDLVVNTGTLGRDDAVALVVDALRRHSPPVKERDSIRGRRAVG